MEEKPETHYTVPPLVFTEAGGKHVCTVGNLEYVIHRMSNGAWRSTFGIPGETPSQARMAFHFEDAVEGCQKHREDWLAGRINKNVLPPEHFSL